MHCLDHSRPVLQFDTHWPIPIRSAEAENTGVLHAIRQRLTAQRLEIDRALIGNFLAMLLFVLAPLLISLVATRGYAGALNAENAKLSLNQAIAQAQKDWSGKVVEASFAMVDSTQLYRVTVIADGVANTIDVDANSGATRRAEWSKPSDDMLSLVQPALAPRIGIIQAIALAEAQGGFALGAKFDMRKGKGAYRIDVRDDEGVIRLWIDATTGHIITKS